MKVGFIGLGIMGSPMAANLIKGGHQLFLFSIPSIPQSLVDAMRSNQMTFAAAGGPDAYFGFPAEATAEEGRAIVETLGAILDEAVVEAIDARGAAS